MPFLSTYNEFEALCSAMHTYADGILTLRTKGLNNIPNRDSAALWYDATYQQIVEALQEVVMCSLWPTNNQRPQKIVELV